MQLLRNHPYRLFFPLGVLLGWLGVGQWLSLSLGLGGSYRVIFHAMVQVEGFLACFITGFLFTFIPKRTMTEGPRPWQLIAAAVCPLLVAAFAWNERWALSQVFWLTHLGVLAQFAISRARRSQNPRPLPASLVWIPAALAISFAGALLTPFPALHALGKTLVLEGMVGALVLGVGAMLVPVITRAEPPPDSAAGWPARLYQLAWVLLYVASFVLEARGLMQAAFVLRFAVTVAVLVVGAKLWRAPTEPGLNRRLVWLSAWCVPLGSALLAVWPVQRSLGLHVIFIGGFAMLALGVAGHVTAAHTNHGEWLKRWPRTTWVMAGLMATALVARSAMQLDVAHYLWWMSVAAAAFVLAGAAWLVGMGPMVFGLDVRRRGDEGHALPQAP